MAGGHEDNHRSPDDGVNFTKLLDAVRQHLTRAQQMTQRHRPFLLSVATSAGRWSHQHLDLAGINRICDHVNIMTYVRRIRLPASNPNQTTSNRMHMDRGRMLLGTMLLCSHSLTTL